MGVHHQALAFGGESSGYALIQRFSKINISLSRFVNFSDIFRRLELSLRSL